MAKKSNRRSSVSASNSVNSNYALVVFVGTVIAALVVWVIAQNKASTDPSTQAAQKKAICNNKYNPLIVGGNFSTNLVNQFTALPIGRKLVYEGDTEDGKEKIEITVKGTKRIKMGGATVNAAIYRDTVWIDADDDGVYEKNELHEDVKDYMALNKTTNDIWYFGEDVSYYEDGKLIGHEGTWLAGVDGAKPGIFVKNNPVAGDSYLQECWDGEAEDTVDVLSTTATVKTVLGEFKNCLKTYDYNPNDPESREHKYYCTTSVGGLKANAKVLQVDLETGNKIELVKIIEPGGQGGAGGGMGGGTGGGAGGGVDDEDGDGVEDDEDDDDDEDKLKK